MSNDTDQKSKRVHVCTGVHVEIEPARHPYGFSSWDVEKRVAWLEEWAEELRSFIRDHRSRDDTRFYAIREKQWQCSECGNEWETMTPDGDAGKTLCASCEREVESLAAREQKGEGK